MEGWIYHGYMDERVVGYIRKADKETDGGTNEQMKRRMNKLMDGSLG